jgi:hypothetical protein
MWFSEAIHDKIVLAGALFNWMPSWWYRNYGITYGERMVLDADYRVETYLAMRRLAHERYGEIGLGSPDPQPCVIGPDWHNALVPALAGARVEYPDDNYPISYHLPAEEITRLKVPEDIASAWPYCETIRQVRYLNDKLGKDEPATLIARGVLNEACLIQGCQILGDLYGDVRTARHLLGYTQGLIHAVLRYNNRVAPGGAHRFINCAAIMVSPQTYQELLLGYDFDTSALCEILGVGLGIHHCGLFDRFAPLYRQLGQFEQIEIGSDSSIRLALDAFPEAQIQYILPAALVCQATRSEVGDRIDAILEEGRGDWHRLALHVPDLEYGVPDENLFEIYHRLVRAV